MKRDDLLDLNDILQHPGRQIAVDIATELPEEADVDLVEPLEGFLEAVSTGNILILTGKFKTRAVLECARCGAPLEQDVEFDLDEQFAVEGTPSSLSSQDVAKIAADEPYELFEGNNLLVESLLRQGLLLSLPIQALCSHGWEEECPEATARGTIRLASDSRPEFDGLKNLLVKGDED